jgi:phosphohistidine swiveling domain-containing protein
MAKNARNLVLLFDEGDERSFSPEVRGGKGAGLARMVRLGLPVPPGFTVVTAVSRAYNENKRIPCRLASQLARGMRELERQTNKGFGNSDRPLLVSVRSGAAVSMPGMMDTILNVGMNEDVVQGLANHTDERFAFDTYRRFIQMFAETVLGVDAKVFEKVLNVAKAECGVALDSQLSGEALRTLCSSYLAAVSELGLEIPSDPIIQLAMAIEAVLKSWNNDHARVYREAHGVPHWKGTAVNVQAMVYGNRDQESCTGVAYSRCPTSGLNGRLYGEFLPQAQGEDVVAGNRSALCISKLPVWSEGVYTELEQIIRQLETQKGGIIDAEFTVESGKLYLLQFRSAKLGPVARATMAVHAVWGKKISKQHAVESLTTEEVQQLRNRSSFKTSANPVATGMPVSSGLAVGQVVFTASAAVEKAAKGSVVLFRPDTTPSDLSGMMAAKAIVTEVGGMSCHAASVARGMNLPTVVGTNVRFENDGTCLLQNGKKLQEGTWVSVDGNTGQIYLGQLPTVGTEVSVTKEVSLFLKWWDECGQMPAPRVGFEYLDVADNFQQLCNDFYIADALAFATAKSPIALKAKVLRNQVHAQTAEHLVCYLLVACAGELRHARESDQRCFAELKTKFSVSFGKSMSRRDAQLAAFNVIKEKGIADATQFFALAEEAFNADVWSSSFGGAPWANIAKAGHLFLSGQIGHTVFADHAFDLQHNNGSVFGKHPMLTGSRSQLYYQLEAKKNATSLSELVVRLTNTFDGVSSAIKDLLSEGENLGLLQLEKTEIVSSEVTEVVDLDDN